MRLALLLLPFAAAIHEAPIVAKQVEGAPVIDGLHHITKLQNHHSGKEPLQPHEIDHHNAQVEEWSKNLDFGGMGGGQTAKGKNKQREGPGVFWSAACAVGRFFQSLIGMCLVAGVLALLLAWRIIWTGKNRCGSICGSALGG